MSPSLCGNHENHKPLTTAVLLHEEKLLSKLPSFLSHLPGPGRPHSFSEHLVILVTTICYQLSQKKPGMFLRLLQAHDNEFCFFPILNMLCSNLETCISRSGYVKQNPWVSVWWGRPKNGGRSQGSPLALLSASKKENYPIHSLHVSHSFSSWALQLFEGKGKKKVSFSM